MGDGTWLCHRQACEQVGSERLQVHQMTGQPAAIVEMVRAGEIVLTFDLSAQAASVLALLKKYADREMDPADA
ncbi:MAG TPA: hypothetical protein VER75_00830, partial [Thermoleophilaceae bacterium]|nr:hypothetical protein [Thermoleophilaceae bacterium]